MSMAGVLEMTDLSHLEEQLDDTPCRSSLRGHQEPHNADWWAIAPCQDVTPVCEARRRKAFRDGGWQCVVMDGAGCRGWHEYNHLTFEPVRGK